MHGFISLTDVIDNNPITIGLHAIGLVSPIENTSGATVVLSFGSSDKQTFAVNESYEVILRLIKEAQQPLSKTV